MPSTSTATSSAEPLELDVTNVAHGGVFVARHEGRVVFVSDAIPGERVLARLTDTGKKSFWRAETVRVLEPSPHRRDHVWGAASVERAPEDRAGGAEFGHIALAHQRELKRRVLIDALGRFGSVPADHPAAAVAVEAVAGDDEADGLGWRTRVRLHTDADGVVGPYAARSHRVIPVTDLPLATAAVAEAAPLGRLLPASTSVDVVAPSTGGAHVVVEEPRRRGRAGEIVERVGDREFRLAVGGFWQVHHAAAGVLSEATAAAIDEAVFDPRAANLDLYGGVGLLAAAVGERFGRTVRITSVEADAAATDFAAENLADWVGASAETARVDRYLASLIARAGSAERRRISAGTVVLDPPRSGAGRQVVEALAELRPAQIVYVACDPVALARDLGSLTAAGYALEGLSAFDLFPHTHHMEAVATLLRV